MAELPTTQQDQTDSSVQSRHCFLGQRGQKNALVRMVTDFKSVMLVFAQGNTVPGLSFLSNLDYIEYRNIGTIRQTVDGTIDSN